MQHGGETILENLSYACIYCNWAKGPNLSSLDHQRNLSRLFHPRIDLWADHFRVDGVVIQPLTKIGEATATLLKLNDPDRLQRRLVVQQMGAYPR